MANDQLTYTRDQRLAALILSQVQKLAAEYPKGDKERNRYGAIAHSLPALIRTSGLAQALAFVQSRDKKGTTLLLNHLGEAVYKGDGNALCTASLITTDLREYMWLTERVLAALLWYKRYAQVVLEVAQGTEVAS